VVAPSDSAILSFVGGNVPGGTLISDVDVEAVPEVSSFGMVMGLGLFAFGAAVRVRRRSPMTA
jgi:MYXO-CTERM domain-containing protein